MSILVIAEHDNSNLKPATLNTVAAAKELNGEIHLLIAGNSCQSVADEAIGVEGVSKILMSDNAAYENHLAESTANLIKSVAANYSHILAAATTFGKNVLPRLSALLDVQQISEITENHRNQKNGEITKSQKSYEITEMTENHRNYNKRL